MREKDLAFFGRLRQPPSINGYWQYSYIGERVNMGAWGGAEASRRRGGSGGWGDPR